MEAGELVPDQLIIDLVAKRLNEPDCKERGWLLDGFPRTEAQAKEMEKLFLVPTKAILLDVPDDVLVERVTGRVRSPASIQWTVPLSIPRPLGPAHALRAS